MAAAHRNRLSQSHDGNRDGDTTDAGDHTVSYAYDAHDDLLLSETRTPGGGGTPVVTAYGYDANGSTTSVQTGSTTEK